MATEEQPTALVLDVMVSNGSFASWLPVAVGLRGDQLESFLLGWITTNKARYAGHYRILKVPFLMPKEGQSHERGSAPHDRG